MKTPFFASIIFLLTLHVGCTEDNASNEVETENPAPAAAVAETITSDWEGAFVGTLPCADCEGMRTAIYLHRDETYTQQIRYMGKSDQVFYSSGTFNWNEQGSGFVLVPSDGKSEKSMYELGQDKLIKLDANGNRIQSEFADTYKLFKTNITLENTKWVLATLNGATISQPKNPESEAYIVLNTAQKNYSGFGACNRFAGTLKTFGDVEMQFNHGPATLSNCPEMDTEVAFFKALADAKTYIRTENKLILNGDGKAPLAQFEAVLVK